MSSATPKWFDAEFFSKSYLFKQGELSAEESYSAFLESQQEKLVYSSAEDYINKNIDNLPAPLQPYIKLIAKSFSWKDYGTRNHDLTGLNPIGRVQHFVKHGITEPRGWNIKSSLLDRRFSWAAQTGHHSHLDFKLQAVVHCYHFDVLCSMLPYLRNVARLGGSVHLLVANNNLSSSVMDGFIKGLRTGAANHSWRRVINYGEDWSSFDQACKEGLFDEEGVTIKMQTKKSTNLGEDGGLAWIDEALAPLCGSYQVIEQLLNELCNNNSVAVASQLTKRHGFGANEQLLTSFSRKIGLDPSQGLKSMAFSGGSIFAAGNNQIKDFFNALGPVDYEEKHSDSPFCGRYAGHALERLFFYYCSHHHGVKSIKWAL